MKLAIVVEGLPNSGKTSTIRELVNSYGNKTLSVMRKGWNRIYLNRNFEYLKLDFYCVPASPSETNIELSQRFPDWHPDVLIVALQINGQHYISSQTFLNVNNYNILTYSITNQEGNRTWERFDDTNKVDKLRERADEIVEDIKKFISAHGII